jgi:hypothetical protein
LRKNPFQTITELMEDIEDKLRDKVTGKGEKLLVERLACIRDFEFWLAPIGVTLFNAFVTRQGLFAPHAYSYKLRCDLSPAERKHVSDKHRLGFDSKLDVFVVYKTWMHSTDFKVLLCLPEQRLAEVKVPAPDTVLANTVLPAKRVEELTRFAEVLRRPQYGLVSAAAELERYVAGVVDYYVPATPWLSRAGVEKPHMSVDTGNAAFAHLPDTSWDLLAKFHRI